MSDERPGIDVTGDEDPADIRLGGIPFSGGWTLPPGVEPQDVEAGWSTAESPELELCPECERWTRRSGETSCRTCRLMADDERTELEPTTAPLVQVPISLESAAVLYGMDPEELRQRIEDQASAPLAPEPGPMPTPDVIGARRVTIAGEEVYDGRHWRRVSRYQGDRLFPSTAAPVWPSAIEDVVAAWAAIVDPAPSILDHGWRRDQATPEFQRLFDALDVLRGSHGRAGQ